MPETQLAPNFQRSMLAFRSPTSQANPSRSTCAGDDARAIETRPSAVEVYAAMFVHVLFYSLLT